MLRFPTACLAISSLGWLIGCSGGSDGDSMTGPEAGAAGMVGEAGTGGQSAGGEAGTGGAAAIFGIEELPAEQTCLPPPARNDMAPLLSETGCFQPENLRLPMPSVIPYTVASPLWSDAAQKGRFFALPVGGQIKVKDCAVEPALCGDVAGGGTYEDEGDWEFPDGTVLAKTFEINGKMIETRLLVKIDRDNWWGYSYQWRDDETEADLLDANTDGYELEVMGEDGPQTWHYPSRQQCLQCHTTAAGVSLGPETIQLNVDFEYPNGVTENQITALDRVGVFENAVPMQAALPNPADAEPPLDERARSYLHANCAVCHRTGSNFPDFDASFDTPFADMGLCNVEPDKGDLGATGAMRILPGDPSLSVVSLRMHSLEEMERMPQIGTRVVDGVGTRVVDDWITSLADCP